MIAACFFVLSIFGANLVNANELNVDKFGTAVDSIISDFLADAVNIGANLKRAAQPIIRSYLDMIYTYTSFLDNLKNDNGDSSQDISIPGSDIAAISKTIRQIQAALLNIVKLNAKVKAIANTKLFKIANGNIYGTKAQALQMLGLFEELTAQYQALKAALADFKEELLNIAIAALQDNDNAYAPYLFKNLANAAAATLKAYSAMESSLLKTTLHYKVLLSNCTKNGVVILPEAKQNAVTGGIVTNVGGEWDSVANAMAILLDNIEASS